MRLCYIYRSGSDFPPDDDFVPITSSAADEIPSPFLKEDSESR